jgi:hypothetical protein
MGRIILGIVGILFGVAWVVVGAVLLFAEQSIQLLDPAAEGRVPQEVRFRAEKTDYNVALRGTGISDATVSSVRCEITRANESKKLIRGDRQNVSVSGGSVHSIGSFDATPGTTRVRCFWDDDDQDRNIRFFVAEQRDTLRTVAFVVLGVGVVLIFGSFIPLFTGIRGQSAPPSSGFA